MLTNSPRIARLLPAPPLRPQLAALLTYTYVNVSSQPTWCAALASKPDPGARGIPSSRSPRPAHTTTSALAR